MDGYMSSTSINQKKVHDFAVEYIKELSGRNPKIQKLCTFPEQNDNKRVDSRKGLTFSNGAVTKYAKSGESFQVDPKLVERVMTAFNHYLQGDPSLLDNYNNLKSHCNGIDFSMPVKVITVKAGTELSQMQAKGKGVGETRQGNYYAMSKVNSEEDMELEAHMRGIAPMAIQEGEFYGNTNEKHYYIDKAETLFRATQDIEVLETTAEAISDTWSMTAWIDNKPSRIAMDTSGGGIQIHVNNSENLSIQPLLREKWENALDLIEHSGGKLFPKQKEEITDIVNHYAMVLYNRASFNKDLLTPALDALIEMQDRIGSSKNPLAVEAVDVTKAAVIMAIQKHEKLGTTTEEANVKAEGILKKMIDDRKQVLSAPKNDNLPKPPKKP